MSVRIIVEEKVSTLGVQEKVLGVPTLSTFTGESDALLSIFLGEENNGTSASYIISSLPY